MRFCFCILISICFLSANQTKEITPKKLIPWYTGSLLALSGKVVPVGQYSFQPYLFITDTYGIYKDNFGLTKTPSLVALNPLLLLQGGITKYTDFQLEMQSFTSFRSGKSSTHLGDSSALIGFQAMWEKPNTPIPNIRFTITEIFPTGKYQNLSPSKLGTDSTGGGSYRTIFGFNYQKTFYPYPMHPLRLRYNFFYRISSKVDANNFHSYGGRKGVLDKVSPGNQIQMILAPEYSLTQNWVLTTDIVYSHLFKTKIQRKKPVKKTFFLPSADSFSIAPAIEYNYSANLGFIWGGWFTLFGRNSEAFASAVFSLVYGF